MSWGHAHLTPLSATLQFSNTAVYYLGNIESRQIDFTITLDSSSITISPLNLLFFFVKLHLGLKATKKKYVCKTNLNSVIGSVKAGTLLLAKKPPRLRARPLPDCSQTVKQESCGEKQASYFVTDLNVHFEVFL